MVELIKNNVEFSNHVEFPGVFVLGLKISEGCYNFAEFLGVKLCFVWNLQG